MTSKYYHTKGDLPWSGEDSSMPPRIKQIVFTDETFDESKCATVETRSIVFARVNHKSNCFACNQGHLIINMINPLFLYLFYIREKLPSISPTSSASISLPLQNTLILKFGGTPQNPSFLYDFFLRFAEETEDIDSYFDLLDQDSSKTHCFKKLDVPVPGRIGTWDAMYHTLKGRWGTGDFYKNFWREGKKLILKMYELAEDDAGEEEIRENPKVVWALRFGSGTSRDDGNVGKIKEIFGKYFDCTVLEADDFVWHDTDEGRFTQCQKTVKKIHDSDVLIGLFGANLWNGLLLKEGSMLVELKSAYGYCANENGRTLSSHNHLAFYTSDARKFTVPKTSTRYDEDYLERLAKEILESYQNKNKNPPQDENWSGECDFHWPNRDFGPGERVLTTQQDSNCYLDNMGGGGWFQLKDRMGYESSCEEFLKEDWKRPNPDFNKAGISCPILCS